MKPLHHWNLSPTEAVALQKELRDQIELQPLETAPKLVAGADLSFDKGSETVWAGIVVMKFPSLEVVEEHGIETLAPFPYVPGLLSFRESPAILEVWEGLQNKPDVLFLDGQGTAHPRRFGVACHLGLWLQIPTIGCAKTLLTGKFEELGEEKGSCAPLVHRGEIVGEAVRTRAKVAPVFISPGHLIDQKSARELTLACDSGTRIPQPTRLAHQFVNRLRLAGKV